MTAAAEVIKGIVDGAEEIAPKMDASPKCVRLADVQSEPITWLWQDRIPVGKLTLVEGDPGLGKTTAMLAVAAAMTLGFPLPMEEWTRREPRNAMILSVEDGLGDTIKPRLEKMEADLTRVFAFQDLYELAEPASVGAFERLVKEHSPALVILDPLSALLGDANSFRDSDVRRVLGPLCVIAERHNFALVGIRHLTKAAKDKTIYRGGGSIAFTGAGRSVLLVGASATNPHERAIIPIKSNLAPLARAVGFRLDGGVFGWTGESRLTAADILAADCESGADGAMTEAVEFLKVILGDGPCAGKEVEDEAKAAGISVRTLRRARESVGIKTAKVGRPGEKGQHWIWFLPKAEVGQANAEDGQTPLYKEFGHLRENKGFFDIGFGHLRDREGGSEDGQDLKRGHLRENKGFCPENGQKSPKMAKPCNIPRARESQEAMESGLWDTTDEEVTYDNS